jgi:hypothetical protein
MGCFNDVVQHPIQNSHQTTTQENGISKLQAQVLPTAHMNTQAKTSKA